MADSEECAILHANTVRTINGLDYSSEVIERWVNDYCTPEKERERAIKEERYVVEEDNRILGFGGVVLEKDLLACLFVDVESRGRGVGSTLITQLEASLQDAGTEVVRVNSSLSARTFYERHGYEIINRIIVADYLDSWHMQKRISY